MKLTSNIGHFFLTAPFNVHIIIIMVCNIMFGYVVSKPDMALGWKRLLGCVVGFISLFGGGS